MPIVDLAERRIAAADASPAGPRSRPRLACRET